MAHIPGVRGFAFARLVPAGLCGFCRPTPANVGGLAAEVWFMVISVGGLIAVGGGGCVGW
jgi:hypothetical protein